MKFQKRSSASGSATQHQTCHATLRASSARTVFRALFSAGALLPLVAPVVRAQRFEGIITMKLSSLQAAARGAGRGGAPGGPPGAPGTARPGRSAQPDSGRGAGRAGGGDGGRGASGRGADRVQGRGGPPGSASGGNTGGAGSSQMPNFTMPSEIQYMTRRGKVRIGLGGGGASSPGAMIYVPDDGVVYTLIPAASMYTEMNMASLDVPSPADQPEAATKREAALRMPVVTHTKKFELIAGHRCEHVLVSLAKRDTDICMAKGLGAFVMPMGFGRSEAWQKVLAESNGFPLKVVQPDGQVFMEVTKVERKTLPEALFTVPETYTRMSGNFGRPPGPAMP